jgi:hypothetical protein
LEEGSEWLGVRGSQQKSRKRTVATKEIVELSLGYGLVSRETSFVAVERRETPVTGEMNLRRVPIALPAGWGGGERRWPRPTASRAGLVMAARPVQPGASPADFSIPSVRHSEVLAQLPAGDSLAEPGEPGRRLGIFDRLFSLRQPSSPPPAPPEPSDA